MEPFVVGILLLCGMVTLIILGYRIGGALLIAAVVGYLMIEGWQEGVSLIGIVAFQAVHMFMFCAVVLFILMGFLASEGGFVSEAYDAAKKWLGGLGGGLAMATTVAGAAFGAVCGSSAAAAATLGVICYPEMRANGYDRKLAASSIAVVGTLAILIPPSLPMILYGIILEQSIGRLFLAGLFPGLILSVLLMLAIAVQVRINPALAPRLQISVSLKEKVLAIRGIWPVLFIFLLIMGGIYGGIFTPIEAAAFGVAFVLVACLARRRLTWAKALSAVKETSLVFGMLFYVLLGAVVLGFFLGDTGIGDSVANFIVGLHLPYYAFIGALAVLYLILGCVMDIAAMYMITLPVLAPILRGMGIDLVWFGVFTCILGEACNITPPVGLNIFVLAGVARDTPMQEICVGVLKFLPCILAVLALIIFFPDIALWLPNTMKGA